MSLRVWLPLDGDLKQQGCSNTTVTNMGGVTASSAGKIGSCMAFNGGSTAYLQLPAILDANIDCSIALWVKFNSVSSNQCIYSQRVEAQATGYTIFLLVGSIAQIRFDEGSQLSAGNIVANQWYHIVCCKDSQKKYIYINGQLANSSVSSTQTVSKVNTNYSLIGGSQNTAAGTPSQGSVNALNGYLNDVRIYDHCLSAAEVKEISQGLVLHYKLDLPNPNLLTGTKNFGTGWGGTGVTEHNAFDGIFSVKTRDNTEGTGYSDTAVFNKATVVYPGETYTVSFWAKGSDAHNIICYFYDNTSGLVQVASGRSSTGATTSSADGGLTFPITTEWKKYWCTWTFNNTANPAQKSLIIGRLAKGLGETSIAKVKLEKGSKATEWCYHVKDNEYRTLRLNGSAELLSGNPCKVAAWIADGATLTQVDNETISFTVTGGNRRIYNSSTNVWLENGAKYVFSCNAKADTDGRTLQASRSVANFATAFTLTTSWAHYSGTITINDITTGGTLSLQSEVGATISLKNMSLVKQCNYIEDSSGYGHHGTITNQIESSSDTARYETCAYMNGTSRSVVETPGINIINTLSCWCKTDKNKSTSQFMVADSGSNMCITFYAGNIIGVFGATRSTGSKSTLGASYKENDWNHIVVVKTSDDGQRDIYCNGVKLTPTTDDYWGAAGGFWIGARNSSQGHPFYGNISDVRAYATALSADDILELYHTSAKIDNLGGIHTGEFIEGDEPPTVTKTAQHKNGTFIESGSAPTINMTSWSYKPAANAQNQTHNSCVVDFSEVQPLLRPIRVHAEYDISWSGMKAGTGGTFAVRLQGSINKLDGTNTWSGTNWGNYIIADNSASILTSAINANETGTHHFTVTKTIPAGWFEYYNAMRIGARIDYGDGTGTISCSNIKVTYETDCAKIGDNRTLSTEFIEK